MEVQGEEGELKEREEVMITRVVTVSTAEEEATPVVIMVEDVGEVCREEATKVAIKVEEEREEVGGEEVKVVEEATEVKVMEGDLKEREEVKIARVVTVLTAEEKATQVVMKVEDEREEVGEEEVQVVEKTTKVVTKVED